MDFGDIDIDLMFIIKFLICFVIFVILPVWVFNIAEITFIMKVMFTIVGGGGAYLALQGRTIKYGKNR